MKSLLEHLETLNGFRGVETEDILNSERLLSIYRESYNAVKNSIPQLATLYREV